MQQVMTDKDRCCFIQIEKIFHCLTASKWLYFPFSNLICYRIKFRSQWFRFFYIMSLCASWQNIYQIINKYREYVDQKGRILHTLLSRFPFTEIPFANHLRKLSIPFFSRLYHSNLHANIKFINLFEFYPDSNIVVIYVPFYSLLNLLHLFITHNTNLPPSNKKLNSKPVESVR